MSSHPLAWPEAALPQPFASLLIVPPHPLFLFRLDMAEEICTRENAHGSCGMILGSLPPCEHVVGSVIAHEEKLTRTWQQGFTDADR